MRLVDANVLLNAANDAAVQNDVAKRWLRRALGSAETIGFSWIVLLSFLRLSTQPGVFPRPLTVAQATDDVESWLASPAATVIHPTPRHLTILRGLLDAIGMGGILVNDAHLAALAIEHGAEVVSFDRDFGRFPGLRWSLPSV